MPARYAIPRGVIKQDRLGVNNAWQSHDGAGRPRALGMTSDRCRDDIRAEVNAYEDDELVQTAWDEFDQFAATQDVKRDIESDLREAEEELSRHVVLSRQGRGRLRSFVLNKRLQDSRRR